MQLLQECKKFRRFILSLSVQEMCTIPHQHLICLLILAPLSSSLGLQTLVLQALGTHRISSNSMKRSVFHTSHAKQLLHVPDFPSSPQALGLWGVQCFSTEMSGVTPAFMVLNTFKVGECQGHAPGDTFRQCGSASCELWWFSLIFYTHGYREKECAGFPLLLHVAVSVVLCMGDR